MPRKTKSKRSSAAAGKSGTSLEAGTRECVKFYSTEHYGQVPRLTTPIGQIYSMCQIANEATITAAYGGGQGSYVLLATNFPGFSGIASVFDQYRIEEAQVTFRPIITMGQATTATFSQVQPMMWVTCDFDDATSVPVSQIQQYPQCNGTLYEVNSVCFKPRINVAAQSSGGYVGSHMTSGWVDCAFTTCQHFGVKWAYDSLSGSGVPGQAWTLMVRARFSFRAVR
jgi:hypothetical protein